MTTTMDLEGLFDRRVITQETLEWLKPIYDQETAELEEIILAAEERRNNPFYQQDSDDEEDDLLTTSTSTLKGIEGTDFEVTFVTDTNSNGHGNKVWHASIATCRYLKEDFLPSRIASAAASSFRCLELGAGTAVPSFFLAQLLSKEQPSKQQNVLRITDAKYYRNVMQILRSVDIQEKAKGQSDGGNGSNVRIEVHPHNWGESIDFGKDEDTNDDDSSPQHDLVIVSDCIYAPEYHNDLLVSLSRTLALPRENTDENYTGGVGVVSFSLHGNVQDAVIWEFLETKLPSITRSDRSGRVYALKAACKSTITKLPGQPCGAREGWDMEDTMIQLDMITEGMRPERWIAYVYEITWAPLDD